MRHYEPWHSLCHLNIFRFRGTKYVYDAEVSREIAMRIPKSGTLEYRKIIDWSDVEGKIDYQLYDTVATDESVRDRYLG